MCCREREETLEVRNGRDQGGEGRRWMSIWWLTTQYIFTVVSMTLAWSKRGLISPAETDANQITIWLAGRGPGGLLSREAVAAAFGEGSHQWSVVLPKACGRIVLDVINGLDRVQSHTFGGRLGPSNTAVAGAGRMRPACTRRRCVRGAMDGGNRNACGSSVSSGGCEGIHCARQAVCWFTDRGGRGTAQAIPRSGERHGRRWKIPRSGRET